MTPESDASRDLPAGGAPAEALPAATTDGDLAAPAPVEARIPNFDVLRVALALEVVGIHLANAADVSAEWALVNPVPAFVCLSGYVIPASFSNSRDWGHFAWKRLLRVMPPLLLSFMLVGAIGGIPALWPTFLYYATAGTIAAIGLNLPLWSLLVEEVLYAYHGVSRVVLKRWTIGMPIAALIVCELLRHLGTPVIEMRQWRAACCFFAGNILYFYRDRLDRLDWRWLLLLIPYLARGAYAPVWKVLNPWLDVPAMVGILILAYRLPQIRFRIPDLSYGIYVYHYPFLILYDTNGFTGLTLAALTLGSTIALSLASWYGIEKRALSLKNFRWKKPLGTGGGLPA